MDFGAGMTDDARMTTQDGQFTEEQYAQAFREFHAGHIERQTSALETIRALLGVLVLIVVVGGILGAVAFTQG